MVGRAKSTKRGLGVCGGFTKHVQELFVAHMFSDKVFLYSLGFLVAFAGGLQAIHFGPQAHELAGLDRPRLALHLPQHAVVCPEILRVVGGEMLVSYRSKCSRMSLCKSLVWILQQRESVSVNSKVQRSPYLAFKSS